jgi:hypothetical protein
MRASNSTFDTIVFSGGGFKGAYGAGAAKAIMEYYRIHNVRRSLCFIGNSAGALNAAVMAAASVDELIRFWLTVRRDQILGHGRADFLALGSRYLRWILSGKKTFFSVFPTEPRGQLIRTAVPLGSIQDRDQHLIIVATDFVYAEARAFFSSRLMTQMKQKDDGKDFHDRRLTHCSPINTQDDLTQVLLATTAIPFAFPPVEIKYNRLGTTQTSFFVDGGVGNNVPTREAAYFHRYLEDMGLGLAGDTYCIKLSPKRIVADRLERDPFAILLRTYDVYDYIHMERIVAAWYRINRELDRWSTLQAGFNDYLARQIQDDALRRELATKVQDFAPRQHKLPLLEIEPSQPLGGTLDFSRQRIRGNIKMGYDDASNALEKRGMVTAAERDLLINNFRLPEG